MKIYSKKWKILVKNDKTDPKLDPESDPKIDPKPGPKSDPKPDTKHNPIGQIHEKWSYNEIQFFNHNSNKLYPIFFKCLHNEESSSINNHNCFYS